MPHLAIILYIIMANLAHLFPKIETVKLKNIEINVFYKKIFSNVILNGY